MRLSRPSIPTFLASLVAFYLGFYLVASDREWFGYSVFIVASIILSYSVAAGKRKKTGKNGE